MIYIQTYMGSQLTMLEMTFQRLSFSNFTLHVQFFLLFTICFIKVFTYYNLQLLLKAS